MPGSETFDGGHACAIAPETRSSDGAWLFGDPLATDWQWCSQSSIRSWVERLSSGCYYAVGELPPAEPAPEPEPEPVATYAQGATRRRDRRLPGRARARRARRRRRAGRSRLSLLGAGLAGRAAGRRRRPLGSSRSGPALRARRRRYLGVVAAAARGALAGAVRRDVGRARALGRRRVGRVAGLAAIALGLICAGAVLVAPDLPIGERAGALVTIATGIVLVGRLSGRR